MRYRVDPHRDARGQVTGAWAIWDKRLSDNFKVMKLPPYCALEGKELRFTQPSHAYEWLETCRDAGLDMGTDGIKISVYKTGTAGRLLKVSEEHSRGDRPLHPGEA